jgi:hypothetical protein
MAQTREVDIDLREEDALGAAPSAETRRRGSRRRFGLRSRFVDEDERSRKPGTIQRLDANHLVVVHVGDHARESGAEDGHGSQLESDGTTTVREASAHPGPTRAEQKNAAKLTAAAKRFIAYLLQIEVPQRSRLPLARSSQASLRLSIGAYGAPRPAAGDQWWLAPPPARASTHFHRRAGESFSTSLYLSLTVWRH